MVREIRNRVPSPRSDRPWVALLLIGLVVNELLIPYARYPSTIGADWTTYRDGFDRLVHGLPLYDPSLLAGPYDYLAPAVQGMFNMPPWFLPLVVHAAVLPGLAGAVVWWLTIVVAAALAIVLAVPRRHRLLTIALLLASTPLWMIVAWGNAEALVLLGLVVWVIGIRKDRPGLLVIGVFLASIKVVPAIPLAIYMVRTGRIRPLLVAAGAAVAIVLLLSLTTGRSVLSDFVVAFQNIEQVADTNIAPSLFLRSLLPGIDAVVVTRALVAVMLGLFLLVPITLFDVVWMELLVCAFPVNLFSFWLLAPVVVGLAAYRFASAADGLPWSNPAPTDSTNLATAEAESS